MCLSVYLGTSRPVEVPTTVKVGHLGIELARWTPPPFSQFHKHIYYLGRKGLASELECSCLLAEYIEWTAKRPIIHSDDLYPEDSPCPFETLKDLCADATRGGGFATIVCDDSGGLQQNCNEDDYSNTVIPLNLITRGNLLFASATGSIPWRVMHIVNLE